jgi:hypothetical protein
MKYRERLGRVREEAGLLEKVVSYVPGYRGYKEKELRRESDRLIRMEAVGRLRAAKDIMRRGLTNPVMVQRISGEDAWRFDTLISQLDRVTQRIDRAVAGYAGIFDTVKVREGKLDTVIQHDLSLIEMAEAIRTNAESLARLEPGKDEWRKAIDDLISRVRELDMLVDRRVEILRGLIG